MFRLVINNTCLKLLSASMQNTSVSPMPVATWLENGYWTGFEALSVISIQVPLLHANRTKMDLFISTHISVSLNADTLEILARSTSMASMQIYKDSDLRKVGLLMSEKKIPTPLWTETLASFSTTPDLRNALLMLSLLDLTPELLVKKFMPIIPVSIL